MTQQKHTFDYEVTKDGKVFSTTSNWRGYGKREMKQINDRHGYPSVRLTICGKRKTYKVHKLVIEKYIGEKPIEKHQVRHLDGDKQNNHFSNLVWGTAKENAEDRELHGKTSRGRIHSQHIRQSNQKQRVREYHAKARGES